MVTFSRAHNETSRGTSGEPPPPSSQPHAPSLEPAAAAAAEDEADPVDARPTGLECFPPRPGGFRPLGFCMALPLGGWTRAGTGHLLSAILAHLQTEHKGEAVCHLVQGQEGDGGSQHNLPRDSGAPPLSRLWVILDRKLRHKACRPRAAGTPVCWVPKLFQEQKQTA